MKHLFLTLSLIGFSMSHLVAQNPIVQSPKKDTMNRVERAKQKYEELFQQI